MSPKFLKRLNRFGAHYPRGPGLACFTCDEFTQIKALMFEMGYGGQLDAYIIRAKELAVPEPTDHEITTMCPLHIRDLPPNPYGARVAIGSLSLFINDRTDVDGFLTLCLPKPALETNAVLLCATLAAAFMGTYAHDKADWGWADMGKVNTGNN